MADPKQSFFASLFSNAAAAANPVTAVVSPLIQGASDIISKFKADPSKVAEYAAEFDQLKLKAQGDALAVSTTIMELHEKDMENARNANVSIQTSDKPSWIAKNIPYLIAAYVLFIWGAVTLYIVGRFLNIIVADPNVNLTALLSLHTGITTLAAAIIYFYFGSSSGSAAKSDQIERLVNANNANNAGQGASK